ncbi:unnamed protein product [Microthlaspi erraticum]|uniref:Uncharacterized protein n=1 Tax=Microthlaspi erraticum TaxID=1685480 RepID=A0A6D2I7M0_9BRAS|nr:unnamed protein product [Microthlaspi erraticum]
MPLLDQLSPTRSQLTTLGKREGSLVLEGHHTYLCSWSPTGQEKVYSRNADLGEPECYYFEEYEAPRMNPSVVAAHKRIGLLQKFNKWQGKAMERCKSPWTRW